MIRRASWYCLWRNWTEVSVCLLQFHHTMHSRRRVKFSTMLTGAKWKKKKHQPFSVWMLHLHCGLHTCREQGLILGKENFAPHWNFISSYPSTPTWVVPPPPQYLPPPLTKFLNEALVGSTHTKNNNYTNLYILKDPYWSSMMTVKSCQLASGFVFRILSCSSKPPQTTTQIHIQGSKLPYFRLHKPPHNSIFKTPIFQVTQTTT